MKLSFLQRQEKILDALLENNEGQYITSSYLANLCYASTKTIRNDIALLNDNFKDIAVIHTQKGKGYYLTIISDSFYDKKDHYFHHDDNVYDNTIKRSYYMIEKLLMSEHAVKIDDLAEELYIDRTTVSRDLKYVRDFLNKFHLELKHKPGLGNYIDGDEIHLRTCMLEILNMDSANKYFDVSMDYQNIIYKVLDKDGISINESSLAELTLYIFLAQYRITNHHILELSHDEKKQLLNEYEYQVAKDIWDIMNMPYLENEICFLTAHIIGKRMNYVSGIESSIFNVFPQKIEKIINSIYSYLYETYGIDFFKDFYLKKALGIHILSMESRIQYDMYLKNPMLKDIKTHYFLAYQMSIDIWRFLYPDKDELYSEDEIAYFTIHIQYALMRNQMNHKKKVLLVNSLNSSSTELLSYELLNRFDDYLEIKDSIYVSQLDNINNNEYDLLLTTTSLQITDIPVIQISSILNERSVQSIRNFFKKGYYCSLGEYLSSKDIYFCKDCHNIQEVMSFIYDILKSNSISINKENLLNREMIGNNVNNQTVAFPQIVADIDHITEIIISLDRPIVWIDSFVKKIVFIAYPQQFYIKYSQFYSLLQRFIVDQDAINIFLILEDTNDIMTFLSSYK